MSHILDLCVRHLVSIKRQSPRALFLVLVLSRERIRVLQAQMLSRVGLAILGQSLPQPC